MNVKFLNPFVTAAYSVLETEIGLQAARGKISLQHSAYTSDEVSVLISMVGQVSGMVLYGMSEGTAMQIVSGMLGEPFEEFDELAQSGIGELGNVITGHASQGLAQAGYEAKISPPTMIIGKKVMISTLDFDRLVVPLETDLGYITIVLALRET